ncbi:hypothetical protein [Duganella sp. HH105]|uniref:hypothetical protein n=1 Tax=Duganella sp. HH105 TaxID=1781067 RepID=UPI00114D09B3|nr:hypothetical protein [Duganella sp. HH105]
MALHAQLDELIHRVLPVVQHFHSTGMFAPHAATINAAGELAGHALTTDGSTQLSVQQTIEHFETKFAEQAESREIEATGIFYHSSGIDTSATRVSLPPAGTTDECKTIVALLEHSSGDSVYLLVPYNGEGQAIEYSVGKLVAKPVKIFLSKQPSANKPWWKLW